MSITVIDYGSGNLKSAAKALELAANNVNVSSKIVVTSDPKIIKQSDKIVLPGQGSFRDCYLGIKKIPGLDETLNEFVLEKKKPILGICVGMQLMAGTGHENGSHQGFGWIDGEVVPLAPTNGLKVPHMGWNDLTISMPDHPVLAGLECGTHTYFVHGYHLQCDRDSDIVATVDYGVTLTAIVGRGNLIGTQFHPEKSGDTGLRLLSNFLRWDGGQPVFRPVS